MAVGDGRPWNVESETTTPSANELYISSQHSAQTLNADDRGDISHRDTEFQ